MNVIIITKVQSESAVSTIIDFLTQKVQVFLGIPTFERITNSMCCSIVGMLKYVCSLHLQQQKKNSNSHLEKSGYVADTISHFYSR